MSLTLGSLRGSLRQTLTDSSLWSDAALNGWICDALRDYSHSFPYTDQFTFLVYPGSVDYAPAFTGPVLDVVALELLTDEQEGSRPLLRMDHHDTRFHSRLTYDVIYDSGPSTPLIRLGQAPDAGVGQQGLRITYHTQHRQPSNDGMLLTVPDPHAEALLLYVTWQALRMLEMTSAAALAEGTADPTTLAPSVLGLSAARAERLYRSRMNELRRGLAPGGVSGPWNHASAERSIP